MSQYVVREIKKKVYEIAKFEDSAEPTEIYSIGSRGCSCPARMGNCKHTRILNSWLKEKIVGSVYADDGTQIAQLVVA